MVATDRVAAVGLAPLTDHESFEVSNIEDSAGPEFGNALASANGLIVRSTTTVSEEMLAAAPALKVVGRAGVGVDNIDVDAASARGIAVFNAPGGNTVAAAELTMGLILAAARHIGAANRSVREGRWDRAMFKGSQLRGKTLGLIGAGRIGGEVAGFCQAFGMDVISFDPYLTEDRARELGIRLVPLAEVLEHADVISIHVPLTEETRNIVNDDALRAMKPGSILVNASRGGVVDESALARALHEGEIGAAGLDVYASEPLPADSPLRDAPRLVLTPHIGASTVEAQVAVAVEVAEAIKGALLEGDFSGAINAAALGG